MSQITLGVYRHFKGKEYDIIGVGRHSETMEELVFYRARYDSEEFGPQPLWARPVASFLETVQTPNGEVERFMRIEDTNQESRNINQEG